VTGIDAYTYEPSFARKHIRVGLYLDDLKRCCARTLDGPELRAFAASYRGASGALQRILHAHLGHDVSLESELLLPPELSERLHRTSVDHQEWRALGERLHKEQASLITALRAMRLPTRRIAQLLSISATRVNALETPAAMPKRPRRGRVQARMLPRS
jgi:hypothetical protein